MFRFVLPGVSLLLGVGLQLAGFHVEWLGWVLIGIAAAWTLVAISAAVLRKPLGRYRERHVLKHLGQECMEIAQAMAKDLPLKRKEDTVEFRDTDAETATLLRYNRDFASRVYITSRQLERLDVIDRSQREELAVAPDDLPSYFQRVQGLADLGSRLGGMPPESQGSSS